MNPFGKQAGKTLYLFLCFWTPVLMISCKRPARYSNPHAVIALQPLNGYDRRNLDFVRDEVQQFFDRKVIVLPDRSLSDSFVNRSKGKRYDASKIINWLGKDAGDTVIAVVGLTDEDIYTTDRDASGKIKKPESTYAVWGIFGLGYCPGNSCVVSERRLHHGSRALFEHRLRTVVLHEIGHNMGLPHCPVKNCIMSDANEKIATVDQSGRDYCPACRRHIFLGGR